MRFRFNHLVLFTVNAPASQVPYDVPSADPFSGAAGLPYFGQPTVGFFQQQQPQPAYFGQPAKFTDDELRLFAANFEGTGLDVSQIFSTAEPSVAAAAKTASDPPKGGVDKVATDEGTAGKAEAAVGGGESETREVQESPKKSHTVQIVRDDVYNGQLTPS